MIPMVMDGVGDRAQVSPVGLAVLKLLGFVRQKITNAQLSHMPDEGIMQWEQSSADVNGCSVQVLE